MLRARGISIERGSNNIVAGIQTETFEKNNHKIELSLEFMSYICSVNMNVLGNLKLKLELL